MKQIITGIDIGTSKISAVVCHLKSTDEIEVLGVGTSIFKGCINGIISDESLFINAFQNCLKRAQASSNQVITDIFVNIPQGNAAFSIQTGIIQTQFDEKMISKKDRELAMKKSVQCVDKHQQSVLHLIPIEQRIDGKNTHQIAAKSYTQMEIDTGIILCDNMNLKIIFSNIKKCELNLKGIISDYLSMGAVLTPKSWHLFIDIGSQVTSFCIYNQHQLKYAQTIPIGSDHITQDLSLYLKCSNCEAERIKILHGQLNPTDDLTQDVPIQTHSGLQIMRRSYINSIIESRFNQLFQTIQKKLIHAPNFECISLCGSGANLNGLPGWIETKFSKPIVPCGNNLLTKNLINSNSMMAMGQIIYGYQIGLLNSKKKSFFKSTLTHFLSRK
jgi:cell division protein FtsA